MHQDSAKALRDPSRSRQDSERSAALPTLRGLPSTASRVEARSHASSCPRTIKVLVVDDHTLFRQAVVSLLEQVDQVRVVGQAGSGTETVWLARKLMPDVIVMAVTMSDGDGMTTAKELRALGVRAAIVMVTMHREWRFIERARKAGVSGYVHKQDAFEDLVYAVRAVHRGASFCSPSLAGELGLTGDNDPPLTDRERQILILIAEGHRSQVIGAKLFLSIKTIESHRRRISQKLNLRGPADFTRYAIKIGLVQP